jgi:histone-lysine N-methyltransferase SETMAR
VAVSQLLERYEREGAEFLDSIVTCDETWVHYFTPQSKRASKQCKHTHSPPPKKAKAIFFAGKIMATVFWDSKGIIHLDFLTGQKTINAQYYSTLLNEKVKSAIRLKRRKMQDSVCFLQGNARPHTATLMMATLLNLKWDVLPHPPYSPDLALSDYYLFGPMKGGLGGKRFRNNEEVIAAVQDG